LQTYLLSYLPMILAFFHAATPSPAVQHLFSFSMSWFNNVYCCNAYMARHCDCCTMTAAMRRSGVRDNFEYEQGHIAAMEARMCSSYRGSWMAFGSAKLYWGKNVGLLFTNCTHFNLAISALVYSSPVLIATSRSPRWLVSSSAKAILWAIRWFLTDCWEQILWLVWLRTIVLFPHFEKWGVYI
jgi:hypothetical protein